MLNVEGTSLLGVTVQEALEELNKAMNRNSVSFFLIVGGDLTSYSCCYMKVGTDIENCNKLE